MAHGKEGGFAAALGILTGCLARGVATAVDLVELALWYWVVSYAASSLGERIRRPSFRRRLEQFSGVAFLGSAANLALADHRA
ncbi:hypothetical protein AB0H77_01385 [Streptomyces sp. NPDC050844]|uniref:hypothetical protein n=1 Tax=Streptomyces sp. NPDC050844 TaxID=3155790 RepID=UPI0033D97B6B